MNNVLPHSSALGSMKSTAFRIVVQVSDPWWYEAQALESEDEGTNHASHTSGATCKLLNLPGPQFPYQYQIVPKVSSSS